MSIVLNECEWAENKIKEHSLGNKPMETLTRVARYYVDQQYSKQAVRKLLDTFMLQCDPDISLAKWSNTLDSIAKNSDKYKPIKLQGVPISRSELESIHNLKSTMARRLAFTLLCVAKYWDAASPRNNHWVNTSDAELLKMANIVVSARRQSDLFRTLRDAGLIQFSKKVDNLNVRVLFCDDNEREMYIQDFRNLGFQYERHYGGRFYECVNCGLVVKMPKNTRGAHPKYCKACAVEIGTKQRVDAVMRHRNNYAS